MTPPIFMIIALLILTICTDGLCTMLVSTRAPNQEDTSVWYKFWDAAVAINAMCIRKGQSGIWDDLGKPLTLFTSELCGSLTDAMKVSKDISKSK